MPELAYPTVSASELAALPGSRVLGDFATLFNARRIGLGDITDVLSSIEGSLSGASSDVAGAVAADAAGGSDLTGGETVAAPDYGSLTAGGSVPAAAAQAPSTTGAAMTGAVPLAPVARPQAAAAARPQVGQQLGGAVGAAGGSFVGGILTGVGDVLKGVAAAGADVPTIAAAFGQNKALNAQQALQQEAIKANETVALANAQEAALSSANVNATATAVLPWLGGAAIVGTLVYFAIRKKKRGRR